MLKYVMSNLIPSTFLVDITKERLMGLPSEFREMLNLVIIQVGDDLGSTKYISLKKKVGEEFRAKVNHIHLPEGTTQAELEELVGKLNLDSEVHGIMIQSPIPSMDLAYLANQIHPEKDMDGMGLNSLVHSAVMESILKYLDFFSFNLNLEIFSEFYAEAYQKPELRDQNLKNFLEEKKVCIINDSLIIGKPLNTYFEGLGLDVTVCNKYTENVYTHTKVSDVIISATGVKDLIKKEHVKEGVICIDAGFPFADFDSNVSEIAKYITPVPGGVGPLTVVSLYENLFKLVM